MNRLDQDLIRKIYHRTQKLEILKICVCIFLWKKDWFSKWDFIAVFTNIMEHFRWLGPNVWWEISQIWREYIKPMGKMSDEPWKFFGYTVIVIFIENKMKHLNCWNEISFCFSRKKIKNLHLNFFRYGKRSWEKLRANKMHRRSNVQMAWSCCTTRCSSLTNVSSTRSMDMWWEKGEKCIVINGRTVFWKLTSINSYVQWCIWTHQLNHCGA